MANGEVRATNGIPQILRGLPEGAMLFGKTTRLFAKMSRCIVGGRHAPRAIKPPFSALAANGPCWPRLNHCKTAGQMPPPRPHVRERVALAVTSALDSLVG